MLFLQGRDFLLFKCINKLSMLNKYKVSVSVLRNSLHFKHPYKFSIHFTVVCTLRNISVSVARRLHFKLYSNYTLVKPPGYIPETLLRQSIGQQNKNEVILCSPFSYLRQGCDGHGPGAARSVRV